MSAGVLHIELLDLAHSGDVGSLIIERLKAEQLRTDQEFSGLLVLTLDDAWLPKTLDILTAAIGTILVDSLLLVYRGPATEDALADWMELRSRRRPRMQVLWVPDADGCIWNGDPLESPTIPPPTGDGNLAYLYRLFDDAAVLRAVLDALGSTNSVCVPGLLAHAVDTRQLAGEVTTAANDVASGQKNANDGEDDGDGVGLETALPGRLLNAAGHVDGEWKRAIRAPIQRLRTSIDNLEANGGEWASMGWTSGLQAKSVVGTAREDIREAGEAARAARRSAEDTLSRIDPADMVDHAELEVMDSVLERPAPTPEESAELQAAPVRLRQTAVEQLRRHGAIPLMIAELEQIQSRVNVRTGDEILSRLRSRCDNGRIATAIQARDEPVGFPTIAAVGLFGLGGLVAGLVAGQGSWFAWMLLVSVLAAALLLFLHPSDPRENIVGAASASAGGVLGVLVGKLVASSVDLKLPPAIGVVVGCLGFLVALDLALAWSVRKWLRSVTAKTEYLVELPAAMTDVLDLARREWHFANERIRVGRMAESLRTALLGAQRSLRAFSASETATSTDATPNSDALLLESKVFGAVEPLDGVATVQLGKVVQRIVASAVSTAVERVVMTGADTDEAIDYSEQVGKSVDSEAHHLYSRLMGQGIVGVIASGGFDQAERMAIETCRGVWDKSGSRTMLNRPDARFKMVELCGARECELLDEDPETTRIVLAYPRGYLFSATIAESEGRSVEYSRPDHAALLRLTPVRLEKARANIDLRRSGQTTIANARVSTD